MSLGMGALLFTQRKRTDSGTFPYLLIDQETNAAEIESGDWRGFAAPVGYVP